ncbi:MAG: hypothetical protein IIC60_09820 [Proteobacteria bacterium]|nr:hypothetical protein [Pseudomonadota bacterium]
MPLKRRQLKDDLLWLKWPLILLAVVLSVAISSYVSAFYFRNDMQRQEFDAFSAFDLLSGQVREIESAERIIVNNIDRFNSMAATSLMDEENRVDLLEEIRAIREEHQLFPIGVEIQEQNRILLSYTSDIEFPDEQISLRSSQIQIRLPLLHEEDLARFLADFLGGDRLIVSNRCTINETVIAEDNFLEIREHQLAICDFYWYTLRREPFTGI